MPRVLPMDSRTLLLTASGWVVWIIKEIISGVIGARIDRASSRAGKHGAIPIRKGMHCDSQNRDGQWGTVDYFVGMQKYPQYFDCRRFRIEYLFQLFNDSDTQTVYRDLIVESWGIEGPRMRHLNPDFCVADKLGGPWDTVKSITVPAHGTVNVRVRLPIGGTFESAEASVQDTYAGTVPLLKTKTIDDKSRDFRISRSSVVGLNLVSWRDGFKYPIYSHYSLNEDGREAGKKPQPQMPELDFEEGANI